MCVSTAEADLTGTVVYAGRRHHPEHGLVHVLGYQNEAVNLAPGPNAMLLHVSAKSLTPANFLDVSRDRQVLKRMSDMVSPVSRSRSGMDWMSGGGVTVFDHDIYTVVLASRPQDIPSALSHVAPRKRPTIRPDLFDFYADHFGDHVVMLCCFNNADQRLSSPLVVWYRTAEPDRMVMPGVDAHTGGPPTLGAPVHRDHVLVFGTDAAPPGWGRAMTYGKKLRAKTRTFLPDRVAGFAVPHNRLNRNGDFAVEHDDLVAGRLDRVHITS